VWWEDWNEVVEALPDNATKYGFWTKLVVWPFLILKSTEMWKKLKRIFIIWVSKFNRVIFIKKFCNKEDIYNQIARNHWYSFAISQYFSMQMDRRRYWYWIHPRILKYAWKWKSKTCFNTPDVWSNCATNDYIRRHIDCINSHRLPLFISSHHTLRAHFSLTRNFM
jgi:hypothetical protein